LKKISSYKIEPSFEPSFDFFLKNQLIRYVDINEALFNAVAIEPADIAENPNTDYKLMELHPCGMFGIVAGIIPFSDRTQSARNCFYTSMVKQAIGFVPCHNLKTETVSHTLNYPQKPLVTTDIAEFNDLNDYPNGINAIVAIACYTGYNQEDSVILNKSSIERGLFGTTTYNTYTAEEKKNGIVEERIDIPTDSIKVRDCNYGLLRPNGVVRLRQKVKKGDVLVGKIIIKNKNDEEKVIDNSIIVQLGEEGYVDRIVDTVIDGCRIVKVVVGQLRVPEIGDKFCSGMAQKGTCGMLYPHEDMPFTSCGMTPDIIINPNCIPSRMTINQIIATVMGKLQTTSCLDKNKCNCKQSKFKKGNPFMENSTTILDDLCKELTKHGFGDSGGETMYCGFTGRKIKSKIFIGPTYYHRLKHMVKDKMHARSHGQVTTLHRQPNCGRSQGGGLRFGEMEKDCILVHGTTQFLNERMFLYSDPFQIDVCVDCGMMSSTSKKCHVCGSFNIKRCSIPYSFKILLQELNGMGIKTKIDL
jgi:DNA-directed RNA polymerase II subunit RPB2